MRKLAWLLALMLALTSLSVPALAAEQPEIVATVKNVITVDGLQFKDLNGNGKLDVYEDWRADTEDRITDLLSQMTLKEKTMLLYHICTCSDNSGVDFSNPDTLYKQDGPYDGTH